MSTIFNSSTNNLSTHTNGDKGYQLSTKNGECNIDYNRCPNNYVSPTIKIQHLSDEIGFSLFTNADFKPDEVLFEVAIPISELRRRPDMHTIQVSKNWHWCTKQHPIQYTQHSCFNINCKFVLEDVKDMTAEYGKEESNKSNSMNGDDYRFAKFKLIALQHIKPETVVTVNYNSFEWEMSCSFIDSEAPAQNLNDSDKGESNGSILKNKNGRQNGALAKGREVKGYKFAKSDEQMFLRDKGLLFKHIEEEIATEQQRCPSDYKSSTIKIEHLSENIGYSVFTNKHFKPKDILYEVVIPISELRTFPDMHTIQVAKDWHWCTKNHPIQYTQHSCFDINCKFVLEEINDSRKKGINETNGNTTPNGVKTKDDKNFAYFKLVSLQHLNPDTVVTVNYNSFEWEMSCSFLDAEAPSENYDSSERSIEHRVAENGSRTKGREVKGFKFAKADEKKFLFDQRLLFEHIKDEIISESINAC